jgi:hypothetical protein
LLLCLFLYWLNSLISFFLFGNLKIYILCFVFQCFSFYLNTNNYISCQCTVPKAVPNNRMC